jgi:hypothetical protein
LPLICDETFRHLQGRFELGAELSNLSWIADRSVSSPQSKRMTRKSVVQDDIEEGSVHMQGSMTFSLILNVAKLLEPIHKETHS